MTSNNPAAAPEPGDLTEWVFREVARHMVTIVSATLRAQFPTGAYLVLAFGQDPVHGRGEALRFDSIRDDQGETLWAFPRGPYGFTPFPNPVPDEIAPHWGSRDARNPGPILSMLRRIAPHLPFESLPKEVMHATDAGRTLYGIQLIPWPLPDLNGPALESCECGCPGGECAPCCGTEPCPVVCSGCTRWRP
ncbi:hypothetical protein [Streptomyces hirsutus]|uniref:hypothetical protein n=1 Tax=Streptomyces hirsutus TaxID=35620 RepID=UPI0033198E09